MQCYNKTRFNCSTYSMWFRFYSEGDIEKHPSPYTNPVTNQGFKEIEDSNLFILLSSQLVEFE